MDDLARWLTAQLDEDTRTASSWHTLDCDIHAHLEGDATSVQATMAMFHQAPGLVCDCGGPARMLREIDAKRRALARHHAAPVPAGSEWAQEFPYCAAHAYRKADGTVAYPVELKNCPELRDLAAPYDQRPGYPESWRP